MLGELEQGVTDLWYKDHSPGKSRTSFDNSYSYGEVKAPSSLQNVIVEIVSEELGGEWTFRQVRDFHNRMSLENNQLYRGSAAKPLVLVYQRRELIPQRKETIAQKAPKNRFDGGLEVAVERISRVLPRRYSLQRACKQYEEWRVDGEGSGVNTNILLVCFYFGDKAEEIQALRKRLEALEKELRRACSGPVLLGSKDLSPHRLKSLPRRILGMRARIEGLEREYLQA